MPIGEIDTRTEEEIIADLERRRKDHKFLTNEEAQAWNARQVKTPLSKNHWSVKAAKIRHVLNMGVVWKKLAKALWTELRLVRSREVAFEAAAMELSRMMVYCNRCIAQPGEECGFTCTRDGSRDVE